MTRALWPREWPGFYDRLTGEQVEGVGAWRGLVFIRFLVTPTGVCQWPGAYPDELVPLTPAARAMLAIAKGAR